MAKGFVIDQYFDTLGDGVGVEEGESSVAGDNRPRFAGGQLLLGSAGGGGAGEDHGVSCGGQEDLFRLTEGGGELFRATSPHFSLAASSIVCK